MAATPDCVKLCYIPLKVTWGLQVRFKILCHLALLTAEPQPGSSSRGVPPAPLVRGAAPLSSRLKGSLRPFADPLLGSAVPFALAGTHADL